MDGINHKVSLSTPLYFSQNDFLRLAVQNAATGITVTFNAQVLDLSGAIIPMSWAVVPATDRSETVQRQLLGNCWLLHLTASVTAGTARRGQCYVTAHAQYAAGTAGLITERILSGYITSDFNPSWPQGALESPLPGPGMLRSVTGTNPAAGAEASDTVPTGARWKLRSWRIQLVTAVAVATRQVHLVIDDGATILFDTAAGTTQLASLTRNYNAVGGMAQPAATDSEIYIPLPTDLMLFTGWRIRTITTAIQAADDYGAPQMEVEEWLEL